MLQGQALWLLIKVMAMILFTSDLVNLKTAGAGVIEMIRE
jgi:hypothetical protein